jgi:2-oxoglutarate dehydrogenase E2 component (dihydrolipoamide succinyltransferase)
MVIEVKVPSPGESISEVQLASWLVDEGSYVEKDQEIAEIDSDKATLSISAEQAGVITLLVKPGENIEVESVIAKIDTKAAAPAGKKKEKKTEPPQKLSRKSLRHHPQAKSTARRMKSGLTCRHWLESFWKKMGSANRNLSS